MNAYQRVGEVGWPCEWACGRGVGCVEVCYWNRGLGGGGGPVGVGGEAMCTLLPPYLFPAYIIIIIIIYHSLYSFHI